jgi:hypothetical protein
MGLFLRCRSDRLDGGHDQHRELTELTAADLLTEENSVEDGPEEHRQQQIGIRIAPDLLPGRKVLIRMDEGIAVGREELPLRLRRKTRPTDRELHHQRKGGEEYSVAHHVAAVAGYGIEDRQ